MAFIRSQSGSAKVLFLMVFTRRICFFDLIVVIPMEAGCLVTLMISFFSCTWLLYIHRSS
jgi:hypothetical protein